MASALLLIVSLLIVRKPIFLEKFKQSGPSRSIKEGYLIGSKETQTQQ